MPSNLLKVADACKVAVEAILGPLIPGVEVRQTWWYERFDASTTTGCKAFVWAFAEDSAPLPQGGDRGSQPRAYPLGVAFCERMLSTVETFDAKDQWVRDRTAAALAVRDFFDDPESFTLPGLEDLPLVPTAVAEMPTADLDYLHRLGVWSTGFDFTIREDAT